MRFEIKTNQVRNFIGSPVGFLTTLVVGGVVLAVSAKVGRMLSESIERRKAREELEHNTIEHDYDDTVVHVDPSKIEHSEGVALVDPDDVQYSEGVVFVDPKTVLKSDSPTNKINSMLSKS